AGVTSTRDGRRRPVPEIWTDGAAPVPPAPRRRGRGARRRAGGVRARLDASGPAQRPLPVEPPLPDRHQPEPQPDPGPAAGAGPAGRRRPGSDRRPRRSRRPAPARPASRPPPPVHAHDGGAALRGRDDPGAGGTRLRDVRVRRPQAAARAAIVRFRPGGAVKGVVISDWQLERYRLDELPPAEQEAVRVAIAADDGLRARLAA